METLKTLAHNSTSEDKRRVVKNVEELRKAIIGLRKQARNCSAWQSWKKV